jgi:flagellar biogenesis protein FliO
LRQALLVSHLQSNWRRLMPRVIRFVALVILSSAFAGTVFAQATPAPPEWQDQAPSVYARNAASAKASEDVSQKPTGVVSPITAAPNEESKVVLSAHQEAAQPAETPSRRLAPPSSRVSSEKSVGAMNSSTAGTRRLVDFGIPTQSIYTIVTALTIVVGTFLVFIWALRRAGGRGSSRRSMLPSEAVSVLGRVSLTGRQMAELLRVGNKLVLVALMPGGAKTLTEVTDPAEVDRLVGLCQQGDRHSTSNAFEHVFQQLSREPGSDGYLGAETIPTSLSPVAAAYRSQRGGTRG